MGLRMDSGGWRRQFTNGGFRDREQIKASGWVLRLAAGANAAQTSVRERARETLRGRDWGAGGWNATAGRDHHARVGQLHCRLRLGSGDSGGWPAAFLIA
jgi:hypothetical protein